MSGACIVPYLVISSIAGGDNTFSFPRIVVQKKRMVLKKARIHGVTGRIRITARFTSHKKSVNQTLRSLLASTKAAATNNITMTATPAARDRKRDSFSGSRAAIICTGPHPKQHLFQSSVSTMGLKETTCVRACHECRPHGFMLHITTTYAPVQSFLPLVPTQLRDPNSCHSEEHISKIHHSMRPKSSIQPSGWNC